MRSSACHGPSLLAFAIVALSCSGRDASFSCEPTLTCTLHDERFDAPEREDAGLPKCDAMRERCRAERIAAGGRHACAIAQAGELLCWGDDSEGQLGVSERPDAGRTRVEVDAGLTAALQRAAQVSAGGAHTCALARDGTLYCWGRNTEGQVDGEPADQPVRSPMAFEDVMGATAVSAGGTHSCAVTPEGVVCWGGARYGQAGREVLDGSLAAGVVPGTEGAVALACGVRHSCALLEDGEVLCWGELIDAESGEARSSAEPVLVPGLDDAVEITAGAGHSCALRKNGRALCWGHNESGQLGDGTVVARASPVAVKGLEQSLHIAAGGVEDDGGRLVGHTCAQTKSFHAQCWGRNDEGQLGIGAAPDSPTAAVVLGQVDEGLDQPYLDEVTGVAAGGRFSCILDHDGPVRCWGDDGVGQLGLRRGEHATFGRPGEVRRFSRP